MNIMESVAYEEVLKLKGDHKKLVSLQVGIQKKLALPFICVVMGLMGSSMGIRPQRSGTATSFGFSVLLIFGYYLIMTVFGGLGEIEVLSPFLAAWLPNMLGLSAAGWFLWKAAK